MDNGNTTDFPIISTNNISLTTSTWNRGVVLDSTVNVRQYIYYFKQMSQLYLSSVFYAAFIGI